MPQTVKVCGGPARRMRTWSPTAKWYLSAVPASTTTWWGVVGAFPWRRCSDDSCGFGSKDTPMVGAPPVVTGLAFGATNCAEPDTLPSAYWTPGTERTRAAIDSAIGFRTAVPAEPVKAALP